MAFRLPRFRKELVTDQPPSPLFKRWWESVMDRIEANEDSLGARLTTLETTVSDNATDAAATYIPATGTLSASAATTTHKLAFVHPASGVTYYILLSNV
jgi:hypothetical protein